uniref:NEDD4-binding protein 1 n=1 Tax=Eptatretus burgeri TaxID=7764 RepID=A0A8C4NLK5_EPTBU
MVKMVEPSSTGKAPEGEDLQTGAEFAIREEIFDEWPDAESMLERVFGMTVLREELHSNLSTERLRWIRLQGPGRSLSAAKVRRTRNLPQTYPVGLLCVFEGAGGLFLHALVWTTTAHMAVLDEGTLCITGSPEACARAQSHLIHFDQCYNLCVEGVQSVEPPDAAAVKHTFRNVVEKTHDRFYSELLLLPTDLKRELLDLARAHNPLQIKYFADLCETRGALVFHDVMSDVPSSSEAKQDVDVANPCAADPYSNVKNRHHAIGTKPSPLTPTFLRSDDVKDNARAQGFMPQEDCSLTVKLDDVNGDDFERDGLLPIKDDMSSTCMKDKELKHCEVFHSQGELDDLAGASGMTGTEKEKGKESETGQFEFPSCSSPPGPFSQHQRSVTFQLRLVNSPGRHDLRHVIIDGSDVALAHGRRLFSCRGVAICVQYFWQRGHRNLMVFVPQHEAHQPNMPERRLLRQLEDLGLLSFIPSRVINGVRIFSHENRFLLHLAEKTEGVIVTNANLNALSSVSPIWRRIIGERILTYTFAGDEFLLADDPLGPQGPHVDELLKDSYTGLVSSPQIRANANRRRPYRRHGNPHLSLRNQSQMMSSPSPSTKLSLCSSSAIIPTRLPAFSGQFRTWFPPNPRLVSGPALYRNKSGLWSSSALRQSPSVPFVSKKENQGLNRPSSQAQSPCPSELRQELLSVFPGKEREVDKLMQWQKDVGDVNALCDMLLDEDSPCD